MMKILAYFLLLFLSACHLNNKLSYDLSGKWNFMLDTVYNDNLKCQVTETDFSEYIILPGSLQEQNKGFDVNINTPWTGDIYDRSWYTAEKYAKYRQEGNIKVPFWLNPDKHYVGIAWYKKDIQIPNIWKNKKIQFIFERAHWETELYIDSFYVGKQDALQTPHKYIVEDLKPGKHTLMLKVDNRMNINVGKNAHSISDHTQTNWNGVIGEISMNALPSIYIDDLQIYPNIKDQNVKVVAELNEISENVELFFDIYYAGKSVLSKKKKVELSDTNVKKIETVIHVGDKLKLWSEFTPNIYSLVASVKSKKGKQTKTVNFGFRDFKVKGTQFEVNGRPAFLRGTLECCIFPKTGYPSMDSKYWMKIYKKCKEYGLNHVRFHSWCPPKPAFEMADSMGIYLQVECGGWTNIGDGQKQDKWFYEESYRILKEYGNHPSFCLMAYGNEPSGKNQKKYCADLINYWKKIDNRRLYTSSGGWPYVQNADYFNTDAPRIGGIGRIRNMLNIMPPNTNFDFKDRIKENIPIVSHEIGQWCVYPNFKEMDKYTGVLKPKNFEIFKETLENNNLGDMAEKFLFASGRLQTLCYKSDIEASLRTPGLAGFQLLDLHDFPGQGTALVGVLDTFWDEKGYVNSCEYRSFCNNIVPLVRFPKLILNNSEIIKGDIEFANYSEKELKCVDVIWSVEDKNGNLLYKDNIKCDIPLGNLIKVGKISYDLSKIDKPTQLKVSVKIKDTDVSNSWNLWVYPNSYNELKDMPYIAYDMNDKTIQQLNLGKNVLLMTYGKINSQMGGKIKVAFTPIFWNTAWTNNAPPHTLGIYCDSKHPIFKLFPNDGYSDFQWKDITTNCNAMILDNMPEKLTPLVYVIDDWFQNRKLGILFEAKVSKGKLMVCSVNLDADLDKKISIKQFRKSILNYMSSQEFQPEVELNIDQVLQLLKE